MSQTKQASNVHKIKILNKEDDTILKGANAQIMLDGVPLKGCTFFKLEIKPARIAKVTLELLIDVDDIEIDADLGEGFELGSYQPTPLKAKSRIVSK